MSKELFQQLAEATKKVDAIIDKTVSIEQEPSSLYAASRHLFDAGGKRLRPFIALKSCELAGGQEEEALSAAVAVELIHNFTLIHDDIMDEDEKRRGAPTVHIIWGNPIAITAGNMLFAKAYQSILQCSTLKKEHFKRIIQALNVITEATIAICEGQALDILFEQKNEVSERDYFGMVDRKTASLIEASAKLGAIMAGGTPSQVKKLGNFGRYTGLAFQLIDDALGLVADEGVLGKPVGSDIREGKRTLIMIHALKHADDEQRKLILSTLGNKEASLECINEITKVIKLLGSIDYVFKRAEALMKKSKKELSYFPDSQAKMLLTDLTDYIITRKL